jgi:hypothetical protein
LTVRKRNNSLNELLTCLDGLIPWMKNIVGDAAHG